MPKDKTTRAGKKIGEITGNTDKEIRQQKKAVKSRTAGGRAIQPNERPIHNANLKEISDNNLDKKEAKQIKKRAKAGKTMTNPSAKRVSSDLRPQVAKGSNASGVRVDGKLVSKGKVKAAEKVTKAGKRKAAAKTAAKIGSKAVPGVGLAATAAESASLGYKAGKALRKFTDSKK